VSAIRNAGARNGFQQHRPREGSKVRAPKRTGTIAGFAALGCSLFQTMSDRSGIAAAATPPASSASTSMQACRLLAMGEVKSIIPEVTTSRNPGGSDFDGGIVCEWGDGKRKYPLVSIRLWVDAPPDEGAMETARDLGQGLADPMRPAAQAAIRFERMAGVGQEAIAVVERADPGKGILATGAFIVVKKGTNVFLLTYSPLAERERKIALAELKKLGALAASRL
jgi:F0F1-type ATP synthase membrane subunit c/vacuolar-type H+-ATPase subunit K